jgi:uncharacterized membrane protein HdeD (DUF308 family)
MDLFSRSKATGAGRAREPTMMSLPASLTLRGVLAVIVGFVAIFWPDITLGALVILFAVYAFMDAGFRTLRAIASKGALAVTGNLLLALLDVVVAVVALAWPDITILAMVVTVGLWALILGLVEIVAAFADRETNSMRAYFILAGLVSIALSVVMLSTPDVGALSLALLFGFFAITNGVTQLVAAYQLRSLGSVFTSMTDLPA